jgi:hypothetical protein
MHERARQLHGTVATDTGPDHGFHILLLLPIHAIAADATCYGLLIEGPARLLDASINIYRGLRQGQVVHGHTFYDSAVRHQAPDGSQA